MLLTLFDIGAAQARAANAAVMIKVVFIVLIVEMIRRQEADTTGICSSRG